MQMYHIIIRYNIYSISRVLAYIQQEIIYGVDGVQKKMNDTISPFSIYHEKRMR